MQFVMARHLNSLNYFSLGIESLWTQPIHVGLDFTDNDNFEGQRSKVLKYPSINLFTMTSTEITMLCKKLGKRGTQSRCRYQVAQS